MKTDNGINYIPKGCKPLPNHLLNSNYVQCTDCGRKSWVGYAVGSICGMTQPSGYKCQGTFK